MIKVSQSTKRGFSKKALTGFEKIFLFWVGMNPSNFWKGKLEVDSFLPSESTCRQCLFVPSSLGITEMRVHTKFAVEGGDAS